MKSFDKSDWLNFSGLVLGVAAAAFFYFGSANMPWSIQTWNGDSKAEIQFKNKRGNMSSIGFLLLALNFSCQAAALLLKEK